MANLGGTFDANSVEPNAPFEVIPAGDYRVQITGSEMQENSQKTGSYLKLELEIIDGDQAGRKLFDRLNLDNPNPQAVEIAQRTLSAICHAVGVLTVSDSEDLHLRPMLAKVNVEPGRNVNGKEYGPSNQIKGYKPDGQPSQASRPSPAANKPAPKPAASGGAPWKRNAA
jgi:hypothetical protein